MATYSQTVATPARGGLRALVRPLERIKEILRPVPPPPMSEQDIKDHLYPEPPFEGYCAKQIQRNRTW